MNPRLFAYNPAAAPCVISGTNAVAGLAGITRELGWKRALIVTSPSLMNTPVVDAVRAAIGGEGVAGVYHEAREHTPIDSIEKAFAMAQELDADVLVGVGGGSAMDTAKGVALALLSGSSEISGHTGTVAGFTERLTDPVKQWTQMRRLHRRGQDSPGIPIIQIPTTLSAAEATQHAGITGRDGRKEQYHHPLLGATVIIHDPELTLPTPQQLWLSTGIKALDHAVEIAYSSLGNDLAQGVACNSIRLLHELLPASMKSPRNLESRSRLQATAWSVIGMTQATSANVGLDHALVHRLGGLLGIPHGIATCITLPHVMQFNKQAALSSMALMGRVGFSSLGSTDEEAASDAIAGVRRLIADLGLRLRLRDYVDDEAVLDEIASLTLSDTGMAGNPRQDVTAADVRKILAQAW